MKTRPTLTSALALIGLLLLAKPILAQVWTPTSAPSQYWDAVASSADGTKLVAAGGSFDSEGLIYTSTNSGATWHVATNIAYSTNWSVACSADGTLQLASAGGAIYRSDDSGANWTKSSAPELPWTAVAASADGSKAVALASSSWPCNCPGVYTSTNGGVTWVSNAAPFFIHANSTVASSADGTRLATASYEQIYLSTNSGASWTAVAVPNATQADMVSSADGTKLVAVGYISFPCSCGAILTSTNSGLTWVSNIVPNLSYITRLACSADGTKLVTVGYGWIYTSSDFGATWVSNSAPPLYWRAVASSADGNKWVVAAGGGGIYALSATTPVIYIPPTNQTVVAGANTALSVSASGDVPLTYQWHSNGSSLSGETNATLALSNVPLSDSGRRYSVQVANHFGSVSSSEAHLSVLPAFVSTLPASGIVATGAMFNGSVTPGVRATTVWFQWGADTNYGSATMATNPGVGFDSLSVATSVSQLIPATVYHYRAVASNELGTVFGADASFLTPGVPFNLSSAPIQPWVSVASSADGAKLAAASGGSFNEPGRIYTSTNSGLTWTLTSAPATNWICVASSADGTRLAALVGTVDLECWGSFTTPPGPIYISTNSGATWTVSSAPITNWVCAASSADGMKWVAVFHSRPSQQPGLVYVSTDGGMTWLPASAPSAYWNAVASSADGTKLVAATKFGVGAIYISADAGATWTKANVPDTAWTSVAASADGVKLVAASARGLVYQSMDGGETWAPSGDAPSTCWVSVAISADGTQLAAASGYGGVYTSTNSGFTWVPRAPNAIFNCSSIASSADGNSLVAAAYGGGLHTLQSTPAPLLTIRTSGNDVIVSWTVPSMRLVLQDNPDLATDNWSEVPTPPMLNLTNVQNQLTTGRSGSNRFYKLKSP